MTGFIILDKPEGITSFRANAIVRHITGEKKTGHTGTLDPMATGVLPVALGNTARFTELLPCHEKSYIASFVTGITTDTLDITGNVLSESGIHASEDEIKGVLGEFTGEISQIPPMYSAIKKDGVRLYELARQGIEIEREARTVQIDRLEMISFENQTAAVKVDCSQGTYIRTLIGDIGEKLGCGAVMTSLRRTRSNGFGIENAYTPDELRSHAENGTLNECVIPVDKALEPYPAVFVTQSQSVRFRNGGELDIERLKTDIRPSMYRVYSHEGLFLGIGIYESDDTSLRVKRVLQYDR